MCLVIIFCLNLDFSYRSDNLSEAVDDAMPEPGRSLEDEEAIDDIWHEANGVKEPMSNCWALWWFLLKQKMIVDNKKR